MVNARSLPGVWHPKSDGSKASPDPLSLNSTFLCLSVTLGRIALPGEELGLDTGTQFIQVWILATFLVTKPALKLNFKPN